MYVEQPEKQNSAIDHMIPGQFMDETSKSYKRYKRSKRNKHIILLEFLCATLFCAALMCAGIGTAVEERTGASLALNLASSNTPQVTVVPGRLQRARPVSTALSASKVISGTSLGVYGNPWGYNFYPGELIYHPPAQFCHYFACVAPFWLQKGYVVQCHDLYFIRVGGLENACVGHRGLLHVLYAHPRR
jgi:hypothetical protein